MLAGGFQETRDEVVADIEVAKKKKKKKIKGKDGGNKSNDHHQISNT
jgi:hypothetical protein